MPEKPMFGTSTKPVFNDIKMRPELATSTTVLYTVDATNAKIYVGRATTTVSSIVAGDMIWVQGKVTGQNVAANLIMIMTVRPPKNEPRKNEPFTGDGQPVVAGQISSISTSTLTITNSGNVSYTVDMTGAKIFEGNKTASSSDMAVGD